MTNDMGYIPYHYDACPIQLLLLFVLAYEGTKYLRKKFSVKLCYDVIVSLIKFIEDRRYLFPLIATFYHEKVNLSFTPCGTRMHI